MKFVILAVLAALLLAAPAASAAAPGDPGYVDGPCGGSIAPEPDPCLAAQGVVRYTFVSHIVNAQTFKNWKRDNPGELARLTTFMAAPTCPTPKNPAAPLMKTMLGAALVNVIQVYACVLGVDPVVLPAPNPPPTGKDKTSPSMPGAVTVTP